jgi:hypothetical protein
MIVNGHFGGESFVVIHCHLWSFIVFILEKTLWLPVTSESFDVQYRKIYNL